MRAAELDARSSAELLKDARLPVQAEVATYFALRAADSEMAVLAETIEAFRRSMDVARAQLQEGERSRLDLDRPSGRRRLSQVRAAPRTRSRHR